MRANTIHIDKYGVQHEIKLLKAGYGGASTELRGSAGFLRFQHDNLNEANPFVTPIQNGRLEFGAWIDSSAGDAVINELLLSQEGDWIAEWYQNNTLFWKGIVEPDLTVVSEGPYPYEIKLTAKDVTYLGATSYAIGGLKELLISILAKALNSAGYALPIRTRTSWVCQDTDTTEDFLRQVYVSSNNLKDFAEPPATSTEDVPWTNLRVVEEMARAFKLFIRQADGHWLVEQMSAHATPDSVLETIYTSAGVYVSDSNIDPTITANNDISVVLGSTRQTSPAFGFVQSTYEHRTRSSGIRFLSSHNVDSIPLSFAQTFIVDGTQNITFTGTVQSRLVTPLPDSSFIEEPYAEVEIRVGDLYYDASLTVADWVSTPTRIKIKLFDTTGTGEVIRSGGTALRQNFAGTFNIITKIVPTLLTAGNTLTITIYPSVLPATATTNYLGLDLNISNFDGEKDSRALKYEISQTGDYSLGYDDGAVYFGSGPALSSPGALSFSVLPGTPLTNSLITNWNRRGASPSRILAINIIKEVLDQTREYRGILEANIRRAGYSPSKTLEYDGKYWFYIGGTFDGYTGDWTVVFKENVLRLSLDSQVTLISAPGTNVTSNLLQAISSSRNEAIEAGASDGMRLRLEASGTVSQIQVYDRERYIDIKAGQVLRIVNPVTLSGEQVTATLDRSGNVITIETKTLAEAYPAGSYVFISQSSVQAGILIGDTAIKLFAESNSIGMLVNTVTGNTPVNSLVIRLNVRIRKGQDLQVVGFGKTVYRFTSADNYEPGVRTVDIRNEDGNGQVISATAGAVVFGNPVSTQAEINVSPGEIVLSVESERQANAIAITTAPIGIGAVTSIPVTNAQTITLRTGDHITVTDRAGSYVDLTVSSGQSITGATTVINATGTATVQVGAGAQVVQPAWNQTGEINVQAGQVVLKAESVSGEITKLALVRLDATATSGSSLLLQADQITVAGQTTFLSALNAEGFPTVSGINVTIQATTAPTVRPSGDALVFGDLWINTTIGNKPYVWTSGSPNAWVQAYTQIDGGFISTGTVDTARLNVSNIITVGGISTVTYADTVASTAQANAISTSRSNLSATIRSTTAPTLRGDGGALVAGDTWIKTNSGNLPHTWSGSVWVQDYTIIDGGSISTGAIESANYAYTSGNFNTAGTIFDLTTGFIRSVKFAIDSSGNGIMNGFTVDNLTIPGSTAGSPTSLSFNGVDTEVSPSQERDGAFKFGTFRGYTLALNAIANKFVSTVPGVQDSCGTYTFFNDMLQVLPPNNYIAKSISSATLIGAEFTGCWAINMNPNNAYAFMVSGDVRLDVTTDTTATAGANTLPANPVGFIEVNIGGTNRKIPYYAE